jgi:hypothetical protein
MHTSLIYSAPTVLIYEFLEKDLSFSHNQWKKRDDDGNRTSNPSPHLNKDDRDTPERWSRRRKSPQALAFRARLMLACAEGKRNRDIAVAFQGTRPTVGKRRARFIERRLDGLVDEPPPGVPRRITGVDVVGVPGIWTWRLNGI